MADPTKKLNKETPVEQPVIETPTPPVATTAQESEVQLIQANKFQDFKNARTGAPTAVLPFGRRVDATPYVKNRYRNAKMQDVLANPESILTEEWIREHRGWKYEWPVKGKNDTSAYINAERYKAVPWSAIDKRNHNAMVMQTAEGHVCWMQHILVALHPDVHYEEKQLPVDEYLGRMSMNRRVVEEELNQNFGSHGYRAEYSVSDRREER